MYKIEKGKPFYFSLTTLIYNYNIPRNLEKSYLKYFWVQYAGVKLIFVFCAILEVILHTIMALKNETGADLSEDFAVLMGSVGALLVCFLFTMQFNTWVDFLNDVTFFEHRGDIAVFEKRIKNLGLVTMIYYGFCLVGIVVYGLINFSHLSDCKRMNVEKDTHEICGTFYPIWLPFDVTDLWSIIIISVIQTLICATILPAAAMISCIVWEATEILVIHINLLKECFMNLFEGTGELSDRLRICIKYHVRILSMASRLNILVKFTVSQMAFMAAIVFGVILNQILRTRSMTGAIFLIGYIAGIFLMCHSGERIKNETLSITDAVWASNWYKADAQTMRDLAFVLLRCQKPIYFEALPLGILDYPLFVMILKTSYSYLTLLNQTM